MYFCLYLYFFAGLPYYFHANLLIYEYFCGPDSKVITGPHVSQIYIASGIYPASVIYYKIPEPCDMDPCSER
jgi:hypothetical protein